MKRSSKSDCVQRKVPPDADLIALGCFQHDGAKLQGKFWLCFWNHIYLNPEDVRLKYTMPFINVNTLNIIAKRNGDLVEATESGALAVRRDQQDNNNYQM